MVESVWIVGYAMTLAMGLLGARFLQTGARSSALPEVLIGGFFLASGPLGYLPAFLPAGPHLPADLAVPFRSVGLAGVLVACLALCLFTWRVFRPDEDWARWLALGCCVGMTGGWLALGIEHGFSTPAAASAGHVVGTTARVVAFAWASFEPFVYYTNARRRVRLGLTDPVVANRFLLWSIWASASLVVLATTTVDGFLMVMRGPDPVRQLWVIAILIVAALPCGVAMWLTFFPPPAYRRWIAARATRAARGAAFGTRTVAP
jgi:hypothetical protein